jgi:uncharacterized protein YkwD
MEKILVILFVLISTIGFSQKPTDIVDKNNINIIYLEKLIFKGINNHRKLNKKDSLIWNSTLHIESQKHSKWMYDNNKFIHSNDDNFSGECCLVLGVSPNETYIDFSNFIVNGWITSIEHNKVLLYSGKNNTGGVGIFVKSNCVLITFRFKRGQFLIDKNDPKLKDMPTY